MLLFATGFDKACLRAGRLHDDDETRRRKTTTRRRRRRFLKVEFKQRKEKEQSTTKHFETNRAQKAEITRNREFGSFLRFPKFQNSSSLLGSPSLGPGTTISDNFLKTTQTITSKETSSPQSSIPPYLSPLPLTPPNVTFSCFLQKKFQIFFNF